MQKNNKNRTKVFKYSTEGAFLSEYESISEAAERNGTSSTCIANAVFGGTKYNMSHGFIWLRESMKDNIVDIVSRRKEDLRRKDAVAAEKNKPKPKPNRRILTRVERRGDYIFIEKNLSCEQRCLRCGIYNTELPCPPCDNRDREDGKSGYWRYCKPAER